MSSARSSKADPELLPSAALRLGRREWSEARELYEQALATEETAEGLEGLAVASWWLDDVDAAIEARERAYVLRRERGETVEAARVAGFLAWDYGAVRGATAVANGWLQRARRLVAELPPSAEHAWLPLIEASFHLDTDAEAVLRLSTEAAEHARAHGGLDIEMTARTLQGLALVSLGRVEEGTRLLDEGTAAATAGELYDPIAIGSCCCNMIIACERARDFDRAGQWCEQLAAFCERTGQRPLLALCRAHHGTVLTVRGEWEEAEEELGWAAERARRRCGRRSPAMRAFASRSCGVGRGRQRRGSCASRRGRRARAGRRWSRQSWRSTTTIPRRRSAMRSGIVRGLGGERPIESAAALELLVAVHIRLGELDAAREPPMPNCCDRRRRRDRFPAGGRALRRRLRSRSRTSAPRRPAPRSRMRSTSTSAASRRSRRRRRGSRWRGRSQPTSGPTRRSSRRSRRSRSFEQLGAAAGDQRRRQARRPARRAEHRRQARRAHAAARSRSSRSSPRASPTADRRPTRSSASTRCTATSRTSTRSSASRPEPRPLRWAPSAASSADRTTSPSIRAAGRRATSRPGERWPDRAMTGAGRSGRLLRRGPQPRGHEHPAKESHGKPSAKGTRRA